MYELLKVGSAPDQGLHLESEKWFSSLPSCYGSAQGGPIEDKLRKIQCLFPWFISISDDIKINGHNLRSSVSICLNFGYALYRGQLNKLRKFCVVSSRVTDFITKTRVWYFFSIHPVHTYFVFRRWKQGQYCC